MAYSRIKKQDHMNSYYTEIVCDTLADLATLPKQPECATGSCAIVIETSDVYVLNSQGEWVNISTWIL